MVAFLLCAAAVNGVQAQTGMLQGTVSTIGAGGQPESLPGASLTLTAAGTGTKPPLTTVTGATGTYRFTDLAAGEYTVTVECTGFKPFSGTVDVRSGTALAQNFDLEIAGVSDQVTVGPENEGVNTTDSAVPVSFGQAKLQTLPLANERFEDALPLVPGVVRGPDGLINVKGARASQSGLTVNSTNVTDPVTGEFALNLPIEAVESVAVLTNPYAAEYGQFTGGVTAVQTRSGTDKFDVQVDSFLPRIRRSGGSTAGIEAFTPRVTVSGPLIKDRVKFIQSFEYRFISTPIENLPARARNTDLESFDSLSQLDWDINDNDHLTTTFSLFPEKLRYVGLDTFNAQPVTPDFKQRGYFWAINERHVMNGGSFLETTFSIKQFDADIYPSSGNAPLDLAPDGNAGNYFNVQSRRSRRYSAQVVYSFSPPNFAGTHFIRVGAGSSYITFTGRSTNQAVRILRADGSRSQQIDFTGAGQLDRNKREYFAFFGDKWTVNQRLTLEYGVRFDRDNLAGQNNLAPRLGFAFLPFSDGRTVIRGGVGLFYDQISLNIATFTQLQDRVLTRFGPDGVQPLGVPQPQRFQLAEASIRTPRSVNWNIQVDREWLKNLFVRVGYEQRNAQREFVLDPLESSTTESTLLLSNGGSSRYRELQVTARYTFRENDELVGSYTRSSARGDLNDFNAFFGNFENPIIRPNERGLLTFDTPNRFLLWGRIRTVYGLTLAPVLDLRNGFRVSTIDENRHFVGPRNRAGRYPYFASLDLQISKTVSLPTRWKKYRADVGLKIFNLTNHFNPRDYQNNLASGAFGGFYNGVGRKFGLHLALIKR